MILLETGIMLMLDGFGVIKVSKRTLGTKASDHFYIKAECHNNTLAIF